VAPNGNNAELAYAIQYAVEHQLGNMISLSFGGPEAGVDAVAAAEVYNSVIETAAAAGISVNVATGDSGDFGVGSPVGAASIPADSPYATGIGGTSINVPSDNGLVDTAWGITFSQLGEIIEPAPAPNVKGFLGGGGGGESVFLAKPSYQKNLPGTGRQLPDVSALADPQTGVIVVQTDPVTGFVGFFTIGGTSLATPMFSAIWALADQAAGQSLGQAAPALAAMPSSAFRDIVPIVANRLNTSGSITTASVGIHGVNPPTTTTYDPAQLLGLTQPQPGGFIATLLFAGVHPFDGYNVVGFGTDSSLNTGVGWDNATGYGVPNGSAFIAAAKRLARPTM
jgi:subtilase family serine protease